MNAGGVDDARLATWLPPVESHLQTSEPAQNSTAQPPAAAASPAVAALAEAVDSESVKQYLSQEAVPLLTQALMDLCMEEPQPAAGQTIPWLINWLEKKKSGA
eukprot:3314573-Rhodomonas_salina.3